MPSKHNYPCVFGIGSFVKDVLESLTELFISQDLGEESRISVGHVLDPTNIIELFTTETGRYIPSKLDVEVLSEEEDSDTEIEKNVIKEEIVCDRSASERDFVSLIWKMMFYGIRIPDLKELLFDIQKTDKNLESLEKGLTLKKVLTRYLSFFVQVGIEKLEMSDKIKKSGFSDDFKEANIRYCFVCSRSLRDYITECFVDAGIIQEHEVNQRLSFVTEVEAVAYRVLSIDRALTKFTPNQSYLICNVSEFAFGIAEIDVDTTESLSTVKLLYESSDHGSTALQASLRDYLIENSIALNLNNSIIDDLVTDFNDRFKDDLSIDQLSRDKVIPGYFNCINGNHKTNAFSNFLDANENPITISFGDLNQFVYLPFVKHLTQRIMGSFRSLENRKLSLSGKYCRARYFIEYLIYDSSKTCLEHASIICDGYIKDSFGAVSAGMRINEFQIPISFDTAVDETENDSIHDTENTNQNFDFVIGIDFGSSFTGCSYVDLRNSKNIIKTIRADDWPGGGLATSDKTPTLLLSNSGTNEYMAWGGEVNFQAVRDKYTQLDDVLTERLHPGFASTTMITKKQKRSIKRGPPTSHYLMRLNDHVKEYIIENETKGKMKVEKFRFRYVMTVPEWWNDATRNNLIQAAIKAQMIQENEFNHLTLITESDAAMFFSGNLIYNHFENFENESKTFILCDAGGKSVDVSTYYCLVQAGELKFRQIFESSRDSCGSVELNRRFGEYLNDIYSQNNTIKVESIDTALDEVMDYFENVYKKRFMSYLTENNDGYHDFDLTYSKFSKTMPTSSRREDILILDDNVMLRLDNVDMRGSIVDPVVNRILKVLRKQYLLNRDSGIKIEGIVMVGGFSQCKYLQKRIKKEYRGVCKVILPDEPINAFSRGSVEYALNPFDILDKYRGPTISLEVQRPLQKFDPIEPSCFKMKGPGGRYYLKSRLQHFVEEGQQLKRKKYPHCFSQRILVEYPKSAVIAIYSTHGKDNPIKIAEIRSNMPPSTSGIKVGDFIEYKVFVKVFYEELSIQTSYGNHDALFDYGTFPLKRDIFHYDISPYAFRNVLIDDYLVNFSAASPYHIDQLSI